MKDYFKNTISILIRLIFNLFEFSILFAILFFYLFRIPSIQTKLADQFTFFLNKELNSEIQLDKVVLKSFQDLQINNIFIPDLNGDTILYIPKTRIKIKNFDFLDRKFEISILKLDNPEVILKRKKGNDKYEFEFLLKTFEKQQRESGNYEILIDQFLIEKSNLHHLDNSGLLKSQNIDIQDIKFSHINLIINNIIFKDNSLTSNLEEFNFLNDKGFNLSNLKSRLYIDSVHLRLFDIQLKTPNSSFNSKEFNLNFMLNDTINDELYSFKDINSDLSSIDYNAIFKKEINPLLNISINTDISSSNNSIDLNNLFINYLNSELNGYFHVDHFSNSDLTNYVFDLKANKILKNDLNKLIKNNNLIIPPVVLKKINKLNNFQFSISGTGGNSFLKSKLIFKSSIGDIKGDLDFFKNNLLEIQYHLNIDAENIAGNLLFDSIDVNNFNAHFEIDGTGLYKEDIDFKINGYFSDFVLNNYNYDDVKLSGTFKNRSFDGKMELTDQFIHLDFNGNIDLNESSTNFDFYLDVKDAYLGKLGLLSAHPDFKCSFKSYLNGAGRNFENFTGFFDINDISYFLEDNRYEVGDIKFSSKKDNFYNDLSLSSDIISFKINGDFLIDELKGNLKYLASNMFPNLKHYNNQIPFKKSFDLDLQIHDFSLFSSIFFPDLILANKTELKIAINNQKNIFDIRFNSEFIDLKGFTFNNVEFKSPHINNLNSDSGLFFQLSISDFTDDDLISFKNINLNSFLKKNEIKSKLNWKSDDSLFYGEIKSDLLLNTYNDFEFKMNDFFIYDSSIGYWNIMGKPTIIYKNDIYTVDSLALFNNNQALSLNGNIGTDLSDSLVFNVKDFNLNNLQVFFDFKKNNQNINGILNSQINFQSLLKNPQFSSDIIIKNFKYDDFKLGEINFYSNWDEVNNHFVLNGGMVNENNHSEISLKNCYFFPNNKMTSKLQGEIGFNQTNIDFLNPFLPNALLDELNGLVSGNLTLSGDWSEPKFNGVLNLKNGSLKLKEYNTSFNINTEILVYDNSIEITDGNITDELNIPGILTGKYHHNNFTDYSLNISLDFSSPMLVINNTYSENPYYYGKLFMTGFTNIKYDSINNLSLKVNAKTEKSTNLIIPLYGSKEVILHDFISFVNTDNDQSIKPLISSKSKEKMNIAIDLEITNDAELTLIFDDIVGDVMKSNGEGNIQFNIDQDFQTSMYGNYVINKGEYIFTLKEFVNKKFLLNDGGVLTWFGDPYNANINLSATYPTRTSLYNILPANERDNWKHKSIVDVNIKLEHDLMNPDINFDIQVPKASESVKTSLKSILLNKEEMNKQVFSLLILNQFITPNHLNMGDYDKINSISTSEVLSNQLGNMISSFTDEFDIGFNYRLGDQISNDELSVAMSTQQFDDRLSIQTNLGMSQSNNITQNPNTFIGDFNVEYKLNNKGNISIHAYNESNEYDLSIQNQTNFTQGVGVFYKQSFDTLDELICEMLNIFRSKENKCQDCNDKKLRKSRD